MVSNVQITMTNVLGWSCLIHSEKEACIQAKGNNILLFTVEIPTSCDWGLGLWTVVLI